jgi:hypothetical protein
MRLAGHAAQDTGDMRLAEAAAIGRDPERTARRKIAHASPRSITRAAP